MINETKNPDISDKFWESNEAGSQGNIKNTSKKGVVSTVFSLLYSPVTYVLSTNKESIPTSTVIQENENGDVQARENTVSREKKQELLTTKNGTLMSHTPNRRKSKSHFGNNESYPILQV